MTVDLVLAYVFAVGLGVALARIGYLEGRLRTVMAIDALRAALVEKLRTHLADTAAEIERDAKPRPRVPVLTRECVGFKIDAPGRITGVSMHIGAALAGRWDTTPFDVVAGDVVSLGLTTERER